MPRSRASTGVSQIQTRRSSRNIQLDFGETALDRKRCAETADWGGSSALGTRRKAIDNTVKTIQTALPTAEDEKEEDSVLVVAHIEHENAVTVDELKESFGAVAHLSTEPGQQHSEDETTSQRPTVESTGRIAWANFVRLPCASDPVYVDCNCGLCAVTDDMVKPPGPTRQNSIHPLASQHKKHFDLTGSEAFVEPSAKRQKTNGTPTLGFPYTRHPSVEPGAGTHGSANGPQRNGTRSSASSVNQEQRPQDPLSGFAMVSEQRKLDNMMHGPQGRRKPSQHDSRPPSRQPTIDLDNYEDDPIVDDGPNDMSQIRPQPAPYAGNAGLRPPRSKEEGEATKKRPRRHGPSASIYFDTPDVPSISEQRRGSAMVGGGNVPSSAKLRDRMQTQTPSKRASNEIEMISDDEEAAKRPRKGNHDKSNTGPRSSSLSQTGDIRPLFATPKSNSMFTKSSVNEERSKDIFPVQQVKSREETHMLLEGIGACYKWDAHSRTLNIREKGKELHETLKIDPEKIAKLTCLGDEEADGRFFIQQLPPMTPLLLVTLSDHTQSERFLMFLGSLSHHMKILRVPKEKLEAIFTKTGKELEVSNRRVKAEAAAQMATGTEDPEDIRLLKRRQEAKANNEYHDIDRAKAPLRPERRLADSMGRESRPTVTSERAERPMISESADGDRQPTRSTRSQRQAQRSPSPFIAPWTDINRGWRETYWKGDESLIFPPQGDKRATVDRQDIVRLNEGEFLNDNLLQFYLRYMEEKIKTDNPEVAKRVLFMNPFFYQRLTKGKGRSHIDYEGIKRWTAKVDVFAYDYVIVPVNEHAHWYLAIVCNTPAFLKAPQPEPKAEEYDTSEAESSLLEVKEDSTTAEKEAESELPEDVRAKVSNLSIEDRETIVVAEDDTATKAPNTPAKQRKRNKKPQRPARKWNTNEPRIITMDSLGLSHSPTCSNLRDFLVAEAKARKGVDVILRQPSVGMTAKNIPEQNNHCDCGLFLLGYVEYFLQNPDRTMHDIMQQRPEVAEHFSKLNASTMRADIRQLIFNLKKQQIGRERAEKEARIAKKKAKTASESGDSAAPTTEPTRVASPERTDAGRSDEQKAAAPHTTSNGSIEVADEPSIVEVEHPAEFKGPVAAPSENTVRSSPLVDLNEMIDDLAGLNNAEPAHQESQHSLEYLRHRERDAPLKPLHSVHHLPTQSSVEFVKERTKTPQKEGPEVFGRNAIKNTRHTESLTTESESSPEATKAASVQKRRPAISESMSPVPVASAFKGLGRKAGPNGRAPSSDLDAPPRYAQPVVYLDADSGEELPSQPRSSQVSKPKQSMPANAPPRRAKSDTPRPKKNVDKEGNAAVIPVKLFSPKSATLKPSKVKLSERIAMKRSHSKGATGGQHIKFADNDDEMLMNGSNKASDNDDDGDSLKAGMSPDTIRAAVEIPPRNSEVDFDKVVPKSVMGTPTRAPRNSTPPTKAHETSSPQITLRSSPRGAKGKTPILPSPKAPNAGLNNSAPKTLKLDPRANTRTNQGSARSSPRQAKDGKGARGASEEPIELSDDD